MSTYLIEATHDKAAPAYWLCVAALCGLGAAIYLYRPSRMTTLVDKSELPV